MLFNDWIKKSIKNVLLVEPEFPIPTKSRNHSDFLPIGLLKIASYLRSKSINVELIRYENHQDIQTTLYDTHPSSSNIPSNAPDLICITSIFTYWSKYVKDAVKYYKKIYPKIPVLVGGIYASLMPKHCKEYTGCDDVIIGTINDAENFDNKEIINPAYDLVDVDYQILHTTRGCIRKCGFCGVYIIEPEWMYKKSIKDEIFMKKIVFYDNNLFANPYIENILQELIELKKQKKISYVESQSGFDGRLLINKPHLAKMIKEAGFKNIKIAWDHEITDAPFIKQQIDILMDAGFKNTDIAIFMLYNYELDYNEMEEKRAKCFEWGVQVSDCRYRPLDATFDNYNPRKRKQTNKDYWINPNWTDEEVRMFRRNVRRNNICIRYGVDYHSAKLERKQIPQKQAAEYRKMTYEEVKVDGKLQDLWSPKEPHYINK
jgi:hypothetical protein